MRFKYILLMTWLGCMILTACQDNEYAIPAAGTELQNDCIKRTIGPNVVGLTIDFSYAMALPRDLGKLTSASVEATIAGATGTSFDNKSYFTDPSQTGADVGIVVGTPSVTTGTKTNLTFSRDTCASTLRYTYVIPEEARGKTVSFTFSAQASNGQAVSYSMGPYTIAQMDMVTNIMARFPIGIKAFYISISDMKVYTEAEAAANPAKIDLVYLYRAITGVTFAHALVSPSNTQYLPGVTLPSGVNNRTPFVEVIELRDRHLANLQYGIYVDDIDLQTKTFVNAPDYGINIKNESGAWVETADGQYHAYIYVNSVQNPIRDAGNPNDPEKNHDGKMVFGIKRLKVK